jgi:hypothetical protein
MWNHLPCLMRLTWSFCYNNPVMWIKNYFIQQGNSVHHGESKWNLYIMRKASGMITLSDFLWLDHFSTTAQWCEGRTNAKWKVNFYIMKACHFFHNLPIFKGMVTNCNIAIGRDDGIQSSSSSTADMSITEDHRHSIPPDINRLQ